MNVLSGTFYIQCSVMFHRFLCSKQDGNSLFCVSLSLFTSSVIKSLRVKCFPFKILRHVPLPCKWVLKVLRADGSENRHVKWLLKCTISVSALVYELWRELLMFTNTDSICLPLEEHKLISQIYTNGDKWSRPLAD